MQYADELGYQIKPIAMLEASNGSLAYKIGLVWHLLIILFQIHQKILILLALKARIVENWDFMDKVPELNLLPA